MSNENVVILTDSNFESEVLKSSLPVLVDFWSPTCMPCKQIAPVIDELATEYKGKVKISKANVQDAQEVSAKFGIRSIPTLMLIKNGEVIDQIIGAVPKSKIEELLAKA